MPSLTDDMKRCLVFHLTGPMGGWGGIAVGTFRPTMRHPTKSAIVGIVAAALGLGRGDDRVRSLFTCFEYAVISAGTESEISDFATVESSEPDRDETFTVLPPRSLELSRKKRNTIVVDRRYVCNGYYTVIMVPKGETIFSLESIRDSLQFPTYVPYLGRKSCPLSFPMCPTIESYSKLRDIISSVYLRPYREELFQDSRFLKDTSFLKVYSTYPIDGYNGYTSHVVNDDIPDRLNWSFRERTEYEFLEELE